MTRRRGTARALAIGLCAVLLAVGLGFASFVQNAGRTAPAPAHADGIVAFTGGADRVETALRLLADRRGDKLLLSGVGGGAELADLAPRAGIDPLPFASRVTLGRTATTTRGNAEETAAWARANDLHSLLVVTAAYHMPRALAELGRALPDVALYALPAVSAERAGAASLPLRLMAEEYMKYLAARIGLTAVFPLRDAPPSHLGHTG